jgi:low temperature requirement protein LtrA
MVRKQMAAHGIGRRVDFRWRSHEISRIEGFSDAVFAFAVTLLVVSLEVPRTFHELMESMSGFVAFALGFSFLFLIWYNQYKFFRRYGMQNAYIHVLNAALLFVVLFFVYPLKFLFTYLVRGFTGGGTTIILPGGEIEQIIERQDWPVLMSIYGLGYAAIFAIFSLMYVHAYRRSAALELSSVERFDTVTSLREHLINVAIGLLSVAVVLIGGSRWAALSGVVYMLVGPVLTLHGMGRRKGRRKFELQPEAVTP